MGVADSLPPLVPFPPPTVREKIPIELWMTCLEAWQSVFDFYLLQNAERFKQIVDSSPGLPLFLIEYLEQFRSIETVHLQQARSLRPNVYRLACRILEVKSPPKNLLQWQFLARVCGLYPKNEKFSSISNDAWKKQVALGKSMKVYQQELTTLLDAGKVASIDYRQLQDLIYFIRGCPPAGTMLMTGTDFVDSVSLAYSKMSRDLQSLFVTLLYFSLCALLRDDEPNISLFVDQLYNLKGLNKSGKAAAGDGKSLLVDLVSKTPLLLKAEKHGVGSVSGRGGDLLSALRALQRPASPGSRPRRFKKRPKPYTNGAVAHEAGDINGDVNFHQMSLITQVQDLFPHLASSYIIKLLDNYNNDVEQITAHLLDGSLPAHLQEANLTDTSNAPPTPPLTHDTHSNHPSTLAPKSTLTPMLPPRRNIHDNDAFDRLAIRPSQIHHGGYRNNDSITGTTTTSKIEPPTPASKAAILSALAAFNADDDERDDTYDLADVGGTIDSSASRPGGVFEAEAREMPSSSSNRDASNQKSNNDAAEQTLYTAYTTSPHLFGRDAATRRSAPRRALKEQTGWTDEAIEGWAVMLRRNDGGGSGRQLRALEDRYGRAGIGPGSGPGGAQNLLPATAWRRGVKGDESGGEDGRTADEAEEDDDQGASHITSQVQGSSSRGAARGRGSARGRGAKRGQSSSRHEAGPSSTTPEEGDRDKSTTTQTSRGRNRKEASKASRANHNRRDQRARKMGRGGTGGGGGVAG